VFFGALVHVLQSYVLKLEEWSSNIR
jgi:hypothetical protein